MKSKLIDTTFDLLGRNELQFVLSDNILKLGKTEAANEIADRILSL